MSLEPSTALAAPSGPSDKFAEKIALAVSRSSVEPFANLGILRRVPDPMRLVEPASIIGDVLPQIEEPSLARLAAEAFPLARPACPPFAPVEALQVVPAISPAEFARESERAPDTQADRQRDPSGPITTNQALGLDVGEPVAHESSLALASLQLLETQLAELQEQLKRLETENERLLRENQGLVRLLSKLDHAPAPEAARSGRAALIGWMRGLRVPTVQR